MPGTPVLTRAQIRELDQLAIGEYRVPGLILMENAGRAATDVLCRLGIEGPVAICCGRGNNGGDGLVIARHLDLRGFDVTVWCFAEDDGGPPDASVNLEIVRRSGIRLHRCQPNDEPDLPSLLADADWILDALLGTGARGAPRPPLDRVISQLNRLDAKRLAIDVPSGLDCDTGVAADPTFRAQHTCTFVAAKPGLLQPHARPCVGELHIVDIGAPRAVMEKFSI